MNNLKSRCLNIYYYPHKVYNKCGRVCGFDYVPTRDGRNKIVTISVSTSEFCIHVTRLIHTLKITKMWILICFLMTISIICHSEYTRISSKPANIIFKYRQGATGETSLNECRPNEVCNIVHRRFWMSNLAERLCRCPNGDECPWSEKADNHSIILNNRSLLKFCLPITDRKICKSKQNAITVDGSINAKRTSMAVNSVSVNCICPQTHYWKLKKYEYIDDRVYQLFRCSKQRMCDSYEFCGFVRTDIFSIYYRCSCPEGNLCITKNRKKEIVQELTYMGSAFRAYCDPWNISSRHY